MVAVGVGGVLASLLYQATQGFYCSSNCPQNLHESTIHNIILIANAEEEGNVKIVTTAKLHEAMEDGSAEHDEHLLVKRPKSDKPHLIVLGSGYIIQPIIFVRIARANSHRAHP